MNLNFYEILSLTFKSYSEVAISLWSRRKENAVVVVLLLLVLVVVISSSRKRFVPELLLGDEVS